MKQQFATRRIRTLGVATTAIFLVTVATILCWPWEPSWQGRSITWWAEDLRAATLLADGNAAEAKLATEAIRQIGANALPTLRQMLRARDSTIRQVIMKLLARQKLLRIHWFTAEQRRGQAVFAYSALGAAAVADVPELMRTLTNDSLSNVRMSAASALGHIGPEARSAVPALLLAVKEKDEHVRNNSYWALSRIHPPLASVLPALIKGLDDPYHIARENAAIALMRYGPDAKQAVPALVKSLTNNTMAYDALLRIDPEAARKAQVK